MRRVFEEAIARGDAARVRSLLAGGCDVNAKDRHGQTGLMRASRDGAAELARVLVEAGADLEHSAKYGLTALMLATVNGHEEIVALLLDAGADRERRATGAGFHEKTALDLAEVGGWHAIARLLRAE